VNRRASLPGVDELFGVRSPAPAEGTTTDPSVARSEPDGGGDRDALDAGLAVLRQAVHDEDPALQAARAAAADLDVPSPEVGALLQWLVADRGVRAAVEVGAAGGVSGLVILSGMRAGGVLTSLEPDTDAHRRSVAALASGPTDSRVRSIEGEAGTLMARLADQAYDLLLLQSGHHDYPAHLVRARSLLHPGGLLVARGVLPVGEHAEALTAFLHQLREDPAFHAVVLPIDGGLTLATRLAGPTGTDPA
jgi:predicted O-methyltransferase YrrM